MYPFLENSTTKITLKIGGEPRFINLIEENKNVYKCVICSAIFEKEEKVQDHITSVHEVPEEKIRFIEIVSEEGIKSYKCLICSVDFPEEEIVKKHISDEHGPALFKCDFEACEYTNPRISQMKQHIDTVHKRLKTHQCHICKKDFTLRSSLLKVS